MNVRRALFSDRVGVSLFLGTICFVMLYWRAGVFITDTVTLIRTLEALGEGHLWIERVGDGSHFDGPGAEVRDGRVYGRNYGQAVISLPAYALVMVLDAVADLRVGLMAVWHLALLAFLIQLGHLMDRRRPFSVGGSALVLGSFLLNISLVSSFWDPSPALVALQLTALIATGFVAVLVYRLLSYQHDRSLGVLAGGASAIVLPVGFWAMLPKRHVFSVLVCVLILYWFALSRDPERTTALPVVGAMCLERTGMYAAVSFLSWIHAAEGLFVLLVLVVVDLATAPRNDLRTLGGIATVFGLSMIPTALTNTLVTGHPAHPPRSLGGSFTAPAAGADDTRQPDPEATEDLFGSIIGPLIESIGGLPLLGDGLWLGSNIVSIVSDSIAVVTDVERLSHIFIRSRGFTIEGGLAEFAGANLSILESAPILVMLVVAGGWYVWNANAVSRLRTYHETRRLPPRLLPTIRVDPTNALALGLILAYVLLYLSRLPLHVQITQRYVLPVFALALYLIARSPFVRRLVVQERDPMLWSYAAGVLIGTQLMGTYVVIQELTTAEAMQVHATLSLVLAAALVASAVATWRWSRFDQPTAILLGLSAAAGTVLLLLSGIHYFSATGQHVLPIIDELSRRL